jgi:CRP-like cAMP-binding protein
MHTDPADPLHRQFCELSDLPDSEWLHFRHFVHERRFERGEYLIREGGDGGTLHYIVAGLVRFYYNGDGVEKVRGFDYEGRFSGCYESVLTGAPAPYSIQALEPVRTLSFQGDVFTTLFDRHPAWDRIGRRILETHLVRRGDKETRFRTLSPEAHYVLLIQRDPPFLSRVPLHQIASYLGITPETLSRIRARINIVDATRPS